MGNVYDDFVEPMLMQFDLPKAVRDDDEKQAGFFGDYDEALGEFTSHELQHAAKVLKTTRTSRTFPVIADCLEACKHARDALQPPVKRRHGSDQDKYPEWMPERQRQADALICSDMGRKAADEGWLIGLWDFCREKQRLPNRFEAEKIAKRSKKIWKDVDDIIDDLIAQGKDASMAIDLRRGFKNRYEKLREKVYAKKEAA